ncbi:asparaginase [Andreprevotia chitinilytica]|uniref:asparaginase n=1 Tax=Andreprevotia chitinilytica TaxID=396808 RepID=UPI0005555945|nr:asparaginase [Andreprevotia chitinilytica]
MSLLVIYTGGTLGMQPGPNGLAPVAGFLSEQVTRIHTGITMLEYSPLLDSSSMGPADWNCIGRDIAARADEFAGFVVLHGTDTLAWTASALAFMLQGLNKPVVLTGAMLPWDAPGSDAPTNVAAALTLARDERLREVAVVFAGQAFRGCRVRKMDCAGVAAFDSPNAPALGVFRHGQWLLDEAQLQPPAVPFQFQPVAEMAKIVQFSLAPGGTSTWLSAALATDPPHALLLQSFGSGNLPNCVSLHRALHAYAAHHPLVNLSLCPRGGVAADYAASAELREVGAFNGADMTPEAALTKLYWMAGQEHDLAMQRTLFERNLVGERTDGRPL